jgi:D-tyrosyl-tRNA(Tyr) deacylase
MIGLLQRVRQASVEIDGARIAAIDIGLLVLVGVQPQDSEVKAARLLERLLSYRVFADAQGRMNRSLRELASADAGLLLVPQFTLAADTRNGSRASFTSAAEPQLGRRLFESLVTQAHAAWPRVGSGVFGADMQLRLVNDGPVTFWLEA